MTRIKIFSGDRDEAIEAKVNGWLAQNDVEIIAIRPAMATAGQSYDKWSVLAITIHYRDRKNRIETPS